MSNDLISREALREAIRKRLGISSLKYLTEQEKVIVEEIDNAPTVETYSEEDMCDTTSNGFDIGYDFAKAKYERPQGDIRWTDKIFIKSSGDIVDFEGRVVGHINLEDMVVRNE